MIIQLNPAIPVRTPKGNALAHILIDDGPEYDLKWVCFQENTGECWTWNNRMIRGQMNMTHGRDYISPFYDPDSARLKKEEGDICPNCLEDEEDEDESHSTDCYRYICKENPEKKSDER